MTRQKQLMKEGKSYHRTCAECGLGPCKYEKIGLKEQGWCESEGVHHSWENGPTLACNPPIATRMCANCGKVQHLRTPQWEDR